MSWWKILLLSLVALAAIGAGTFYYMYNHADLDIYRPMYADNCAGCHGDDLSGTERGGSLLEKHLRWGETVAGLSVAIKTGDPDHGMPAFEDQLTDEQIKGLSIFIAERRLGQTFEDFKYYRTFGIPAESVETEEHSFHITTIAEGLGNMPFSIEPMPDGSFKDRTAEIIAKPEVSANGVALLNNKGMRRYPDEISYLSDDSSERFAVAHCTGISYGL